MILPGTAARSIAQAAACIQAGGLVGLPTETVYGLAADAENAAAVARVFALKGRPMDHPLIVHIANAAIAEHFSSAIPGFARTLMAAFWPGPLTLILPRLAGVAEAAAGGNSSIGLRCPDHPVAQALLRALLLAQSPEPTSHSTGKPIVWGLAAPSANQFGRVSPTTAAHVLDEFAAELLVLDGGPCCVGIESSIIDCTRGAALLLRPGRLTPAHIEATCGVKVLTSHAGLTAPAPKAAGMLASHYAPRARVRLLRSSALPAALADWLAQWHAAGALPAAPSQLAVWSRQRLSVPALSPRVAKALEPHVWTESMPQDADLAGQQLFAVLRRFDASNVAQIWIEEPPPGAHWDAVRDRLQRAASCAT